MPYRFVTAAQVEELLALEDSRRAFLAYEEIAHTKFDEYRQTANRENYHDLNVSFLNAVTQAAKQFEIEDAELLDISHFRSKSTYDNSYNYQFSNFEGALS